MTPSVPTPRPPLRFLTCGSVDDGKSTLIGRLLFDAGVLPEDVLETLARDSRRVGTQGGATDYALLLDGLEAEREQGITIDVAYRYFSTTERSFIVADCPGHEQYTRNMATGASQSDLAVVLVDASKGLLTQTRRHTMICAMLGIHHVLLAVNKMDRVDYREQTFRAIEAAFLDLAQELGVPEVHCIPVSALHGDHVVQRSPKMPWYSGPTLLESLQTIEIADLSLDAPMRLPVQWVNRPHADFRGYCGTLVSGTVAPGDTVIVLPSARRSTVQRVLGVDGEVEQAQSGQAVTLCLDDEVDISRGDVIAAASAPPEVSDQFACHLLWMGESPLLPGRPYLLRLGTQTALAQVTEIRHRLDINTGQQLAARQLELNEVGVCHLSLDRPVAFEPYVKSRALGGLVLIDRISNATVAAGMLDFALRRAANIHWQHLDVNQTARASQKGQQPRCIWFTGLSGAGKSTLANALEKRLFALGHHTYLLDGDNVRHGLNRDLGFTAEDRVENIRRVAEVARLMVDAGLIVLVSFISPYRAERRMARELFAEGEFIEVFVDTPLEICEQRDAKGLYAKARAGELVNFTGVDAPYEAPLAPEIHLHTEQSEPLVLAETIVERIATD